ncbi:MAG: heavy metal-associated domain-containing protein [Hyphomonadaceae bacterium]|nr:heavy metal-associated domain-containing protein [Hyphomonadaceae bacterium]
MTFHKALALAAVLALHPATAPAQPKSPPSAAAFAADAEVSVNGLVCDFCAQVLDKSFKRRAEVAAIRVDLTTKVVSIDFKPGATLDDATLRTIITNAGYAVTAIRRTGAPGAGGPA